MDILLVMIIASTWVRCSMAVNDYKNSLQTKNNSQALTDSGVGRSSSFGSNPVSFMRSISSSSESSTITASSVEEVCEPVASKVMGLFQLTVDAPQTELDGMTIQQSNDLFYIKPYSFFSVSKVSPVPFALAQYDDGKFDLVAMTSHQCIIVGYTHWSCGYFKAVTSGLGNSPYISFLTDYEKFKWSKNFVSRYSTIKHENGKNYLVHESYNRNFDDTLRKTTFKSEVFTVCRFANDLNLYYIYDYEYAPENYRKFDVRSHMRSCFKVRLVISLVNQDKQ